MTTYLNPMADRSMISRGRPILSCFLFADHPDELLDMAQAIEFPWAYIKRSPSGVLCAELSESYRMKAISRGAVQLDHAEAMKRWMALGKVRKRQTSALSEVRR